jgi:hypothetical protein
MGLLRTATTIESLEARPASRFRLRIAGEDFESEWDWRMEPGVAGGSRVIAAATFHPVDRLAAFLARIGGDPVGSRVEAHLVALKARAEATAVTAGLGR